MSAARGANRNGVDTETMSATLDLIKAQPQLAMATARRLGLIVNSFAAALPSADRFLVDLLSGAHRSSGRGGKP